MKIQISESFEKSLVKLAQHHTWWYKTYSFLRWDVWYFFSNIWKFRKELYQHRWWDYHFTLQMLYRSIAIMEKGMHNGLEVRQSRDKKIQKMQRLMELLKNRIDDIYIEKAEKELGSLIMYDWEFEDIGNGCSRLIDKETHEEKEHNNKVFKRSREIEETEWEELWEILKGTKYSKQYGEEYDGGDIRNWWD
jgi:hypothetical protein